MINIAPLDYERYAVLVSPLLVHESSSHVMGGSLKETEPTAPAKGASYRRETVVGNDRFELFKGEDAISKGARRQSINTFSTSINLLSEIPIDLWIRQRDQAKPSFEDVARLYQNLEKPNEMSKHFYG